MKKIIISIVALAVVAAAFAFAGVAYAQSTNPPTQPFGAGMMGGGRGGMMGTYNADQEGPMHDQMMAVFAEKLGISVADLEKRMAAGETLSAIATEKGLTSEQFQALMTEARGKGIDAAVQAGTLTQEQADWMKQRGGMMNGADQSSMMNGAGQGGRGRGGMMNGTGRGGMMNGANEDCPFVDQAQ